MQIFNAKPVNKSSKNLEHDVRAVDDFSLEWNVKGVKQKDRIEVKTKPKHQSANQGKSKSDDQDDDRNLKKERKRKHHKSQGDLLKKDERGPKQVDEPVEKKTKRKAKETVNSEADVIDDAEAAFSELFQAGAKDLPTGGGMEVEEKINKTLKKSSPLFAESASVPSRKKKSQKSSFDPSLLGSYTVEVGMGGPSSWDD